MSLNPIRDRFESLKKRDFKSSLINLLEKDYKFIGSRKIIELLSVDIEDLHNEYYPHRNRVGNGEIVLRTTKDDGQRQSYGKKTEDYASLTVILPLVTNEVLNGEFTTKKEIGTVTINIGNHEI